jgi:hypothetical protein
MRIDHKTFADEQNAVAHLDSLRKETAVVQSGLSVLYNEQTRLQLENEAIKTESSRIKEEANSIMVEAKQKLEQASEIVTNVQRREAEVSELISSTRENLAMELKSHQTKLQQITSETIQREGYLFDIETSIKTQGPIRDSMLTAIHKDTLTFKELHAKIEELKSSHTKLKNTLLIESTELDKSLAAKKTEYEQMCILIESERQKIDMPLKFLAEQTVLLERRQNDISIYEKRVKRLWEKLYPDLEMK